MIRFLCLSLLLLFSLTCGQEDCIDCIENGGNWCEKASGASNSFCTNQTSEVAAGCNAIDGDSRDRLITNNQGSYACLPNGCQAQGPDFVEMEAIII